MKRISLSVLVLALASMACITSVATPEPTFDFNKVATIAAATLTARVPTKAPPTLIPLPSPTLPPTEVIFPTVTAFVPPSDSSRPIRIEFAPNTASTRIQTIVAFPDRRQYVLYAFEGQQMTVRIESDSGTANFAILGGYDNQPLKRFENEDRTWTGFLPSTQDYIIQVAVPSGYTNFTLTVTILWV